MNLLKFGKANDKLKKLEARLGVKLYTFSLPAGYSCPGASLCKSRFDRKSQTIVDGKDQKFRCFSASLESVFKGFRDNNDHNFDLLKGQSIDQMTSVIVESIQALKPTPGIIRVHVSGDYFSSDYMKAWLAAAKQFPEIKFYSYTKSIHFLVENMANVPANFSITCSEGGKFDRLISVDHKTSKVVFSIEAAAVLGLQIDHDDYLAAEGTKSFALLLHGNQKGGTEASGAWQRIKADKKANA